MHTQLKKLYIKGFLLAIFLVTQVLNTHSQTDTEFWFVAPEITVGHCQAGSCPGGEPVYFRVSALELDATVRIYQPANNAGMDTTFTVPARSTISFDASPWIDQLENKPGGFVLNKGVHITANNLITVYYDEDQYWNQDIFALKGRNALGYEFYTPFNNQWDNGNYNPLPYSSIDIVATEDNTVIDITPTSDVVGLGTAGGTYTITLDKGQTYSCVATTQLASGHLGGTHITSDKPIAITLKDDSVKGNKCRDLIGDQTVPILNVDGKRIVGFEYIVMRGKINLINPNDPPDPEGISTGERIYIMATMPGTEVFIDGVSFTTLAAAGEQIDYQIMHNSTHVRGSNPIMVLHTSGFGCELGGAVLPTIDGCTGSVEVSFTRSTDRDFYLNIMTMDAAKNAFTMHYEDGSTFFIPGTWFEPVGATDFVCLKNINKKFDNNAGGGVPQGEVVKITNSISVFHLGLIEGGTTTGCKYGYFSDYSVADGEVKIVDSGSRSAFRCFGDTVQLRANGGISYSWSPSDFLDDPFIATPIATPLPGIYAYDVTIHRGCKGDTLISVTVGISEEIEAFFEMDKWYICSPDTITFDNESFGADLSDADNVKWNFDFYPDSSTTQIPDISPVMQHVFTNSGDTIVKETVQLIVSNMHGCDSEFRRDVLIRPEIHAGFTHEVIEGCQPLEVNFNDNSSGNTYRYKWDLGDGASANTPGVDHTYINVGMADRTYQVKQVVISPFLCADSVESEVTVYPYLEAAFAIDTFQGCSPLVISIDNNSAGYIEYEWDYGDNTTSISSDATHPHTYINDTDIPKDFNLRLVVKNVDSDCYDTLVRVVTVFPGVSSDFLPDDSIACHGAEIGFINLSTGPASSFAWDFGDGGSASDSVPSHVFQNMTEDNEVYMVRLVSTTPNLCRDTSFHTVRIHPYINAAYSVDEFQGCAPFNLTLKNDSEGEIFRYEWDWGDSTDLGTLEDSIQVHEYNNIGSVALTRSLKLTVENADGCTDSMMRNITVFPEVQSVFVQDTISGCNELLIDYTNQSSSSASSFLWEFGDGSSSDLYSPDHLFQNPGSSDSIYTTRLIAFTNENCSDTSEVDITVYPYVQAEFTFSQPTICSPQDLTIYNNSTGGVSYHWDFGDSTETTVTTTDPLVHQFNNPSSSEAKIFRIVLTVTNARGCTSVQTKDVQVMPFVDANFTPSVLIGCSPVLVDFTNESIGANGYTWDFDNGQSSDQDSTTMTFENNGLDDKTFNVQLMATSEHTCHDSLTVSILVHPYVNADFAIEYLDQCTPATVNFTNSSVNGQTFSWSFGEDTLLTNSTESIERQFINPDFTTTAIFPINLSVLSPQGCTSSMSKNVSVFHRVEAAFTNIREGCHPLELSFNNISLGAGLDYKWELGNTTSSILEDPVTTYTNEGFADTTYNVKLTAISENFCTDSDSTQITVYPGPRARFDVDQTNGCSPLNINVENLSEAGDNYSWSFGDGDTLELNSTQEVSHSYLNDNLDVSYPVLRLDVSTDRGCTDYITQNISVYPSVEVDFERDSAGCSPYTSLFTNTSKRATTFEWNFDDGGYSYIKDPGHTFVNTRIDSAVMDVELRGYSEYGCPDSMTRQVTIYPSPEARFNYTPIYQYFPSATVTLSNQTNAGDYTYEWDFDDGIYSDKKDPGTHTYVHWGEDSISLTVSNAHCSDTIVHWIKIFAPQPEAAFVPDIDSGCVSLTVSMTNNSIYGESYLWEFDDGSDSSDDFELSHTFSEAGFYQVKLTVTGEGGVDYAFHEFEVFELPELDFFVEPVLVMLPDEPVKTFNLSKYGARYQWDFGDGATYEAKDTIHQYREVGVYDVSLTAWTVNGCQAYMIIPEAVTVIGEGSIMYPNVFRPSTTGPTYGAYNSSQHLNEIFYPVYEGVVEYEFTVYNRWGERLFETTDITQGWDGYYDGNLCPQDVYVWKATVTYGNGKSEILSGDVTLLAKPE